MTNVLKMASSQLMSDTTWCPPLFPFCDPMHAPASPGAAGYRLNTDGHGMMEGMLAMAATGAMKRGPHSTNKHIRYRQKTWDEYSECGMA